MDRNTIIGFVLIGLVLMVWLWMNGPPPPQPVTGPDSIKAHAAHVDTSRTHPAPIQGNVTAPEDTLGKFFSRLAEGITKTLVIETPKYRAELTSRGGAIHSWILKKYKTWNQQPVDLINGASTREFNLMFYSSDGKLINARDLVFETRFRNGEVITLGENDSATVDFVLKVGDRSRIVKSLTFHGDEYMFDASFRFEEMQDIISNYEYQVTWESGLRYQERNTVNESNSAKAFALAGGELTDIDATKFTDNPPMPPDTLNINGRVSWVATRNKYFAVAIIPRDKETGGASLEGRRIHLADNGAQENYSISLKMPYSGRSQETDRFSVFLGPLDYSDVKHYNIELDRIMSLGAAWIIRPISEYVIIPSFEFLRMFIPNYGIVLILFSIIIKVVLYPLTKSSMTSMRKMQALQPMMDEIREKHKEDPQKMNQQIMRLYKEYGVNPAGGCLPMILQMPILYALWAVFSSTIELRQASFIGWIQDLSTPDVITKLPFRLPIFGIDELSGLALLMGVTMFIQQKMSVKDPRQKAMVWMMPVLMTLLFNSFPAGLNLYYFMFNVLSIGQQSWMNSQHKGEPLRKVDEKKSSGGFIGRLAKNIPKPKT